MYFSHGGKLRIRSRKLKRLTSVQLLLVNEERLHICLFALCRHDVHGTGIYHWDPMLATWRVRNPGSFERV